LQGANFEVTNPEGLKAEWVVGNFKKIVPTDKFTPLAAGESRTYTYTGGGIITKIANVPQGMYFVMEDGTIANVGDAKVEYLSPENYPKEFVDNGYLPTPANLFAKNKGMGLVDESEMMPIIPQPKSFKRNEGAYKLNQITINYDPGLENEATQLSKLLPYIYKGEVKLDNEQKGNLIMALSPEVSGEEAYKLTINDEGVRIAGGGSAGVFYGVQSFISLFSAGGKDSQSVPFVEIDDSPRFSYRGMHLDVSRNFISKEGVLKLLDLMSFYKLNKFHFHITDDEGWRIEIPGLPELTEIGSKRGHTADEKDMLLPAYGSGPFADPAVSHGNGYYTKAEFMEILGYARDRHIEVIPEIDMPGHARAAIIAMKVRYERLMAEGNQEEAEKYMLHDPNDQSEYKSIQDYPDNVICVCKPSVYNFLNKVMDEVIAMYREVGAEFTTMHTGGDEVPNGVWMKSPICEDLVAQGKAELSKHSLSSYFLKQFKEIISSKGLKTAGWEEIALLHGEDELVPNPEFVNSNILPYAWNIIWGERGEDLSYKLANAGYDVVICGASSLYFDLAYDADPKESGQAWAGLVGTREGFELEPLALFKTARRNRYGHALDEKQLQEGKESLKPGAENHILGIQGQLWSETLKGAKRLEYYMVPKIFGLSQRAWSAEPNWGSIEDSEARFSAMDADWNRFANSIARSEFPKLDFLFDGINYRLPKPGAVIKDGKLHANIAFPGLEIRYTVDGSEPDKNSTLYEGPVEVSGEVRIKAFGKTNQSSFSEIVK
ncbi:MAG: family 20 glycosylhydrolase, partial [Cyclobacteriaceae bacterium]|nr:family 20 glycosylhydrolase [Cyclobacteriaceae bacterium]